ncbi:MAG: ABC transporter permease subunit [Alphaproteobacteria bacterium]
MTAIAHSAGSERVYKMRPAWMAAWPLIPVMLFLLVFFFYPVVQLLWLSVVDKQGELSSMHYLRLFKSEVYVIVLMITLKIAGYTTLFAIIASYPLAYLLATSSESTRNSLVLWVLMPFWTSFLVRTFAWIVLLGRNGLVNQAIVASGLSGEPVQLIYNFGGVMIGMVHALMPLSVMTMLSVMETIDANLPRAAATLGARGGQAFWRVYFPLSLPGVAAGGLLVFITSLGFFITPQILGGGRITMIAQIIIEQVDQLLNWGFAGAVALLLLVTALIVFYLYDRLLGMSTLSGSGAADRSTSAPDNPIGRVGAWVGGLFIKTIGWICDRGGELIELVRPIRPGQPRRPLSRRVLWVTASILLLFLCAPSFFVVPVSFTKSGFIDWPPEWFSFKWYDLIGSSAQWRAAAIRSLLVGITSALLAMAIGVPAAFVLTRQRLPGRTAALSALLSPLIIPRILIAVALYYMYARIGLVGKSIGLVLGHAVVSVPYVVVTVMAVLKNYDFRLDQAAWSLGASKARTLWHITFPLIRAGLLAAFLFAFVTSFDELTIALFVSGGLATTLPKQMWDDALLKVSPGLAAASTCILIFVTTMILLAEYLRRKAART